MTASLTWTLAYLAEVEQVHLVVLQHLGPSPRVWLAIRAPAHRSAGRRPHAVCRELIFHHPTASGVRTRQAFQEVAGSGMGVQA